jgi:deoxyribodipyrimidine photo-lyase
MLLPRINWAAGFAGWKPGESGAQHELRRFMESYLGAYQESRHRPADPGTSRLSPYLHFGELSPRVLWRTIQQNAAQGCARGLFSGAEVYLRELLWREFSAHLLMAFPKTASEPLDARFKRMDARRDAKALRRWQQGQTGFPIVDAGMRQLWKTGWMHNRVRMITASFLVKDLLVSWCEGHAWFWDTLVDADLANNTLNWQWVAGCGADAAPFFRIFNPVLQGEKFDAAGEYIRQWVPELAPLPARWIHAPWRAPKETLAEAGIRLGETYPKPMVDHDEARDRALNAFRRLRDVVRV